MRSFTRLEKVSLIYQFFVKFNEYKKFPYLSNEKIRLWQFNKIKKLLDIAYNNTEFYHSIYNKEGVHPKDINNWDDFKKLPTISKEDFIKNNVNFFNKKISKEKIIKSISSGSTGQFVTIYHHPQSFIIQVIQVIRMIKELYPQYNLFDKELLVYTSEYPFQSIAGFYKVIYVSNLSPSSDILMSIKKYQPKVIAIYPSILREIILKNKINFSALGINLIITNSEHSTQLERKYFEELFKCPVIDEYSSEELLSIAYQCNNKKYHITEDSSYIELLHIDKNEAVKIGEPGEIVGTCLVNFTTPLIRYRQGDLATECIKKCSCGKKSRILKQIDGRCNSSFKKKNGTKIPSGRILDWTYSLSISLNLDIHEFQVIQKELGFIILEIVVGKNYHKDRDDSIISKSFMDIFGYEFYIEIEVVPYIKKTRSGKHNVIISDI